MFKQKFGYFLCALIFLLFSSIFVSCQGLTSFWTKPKPDLNIFKDPNPPFYHGVASGDSLPDSVILWTRATPKTITEVINVSWRIWDLKYTNETFPELEGYAMAASERDWTIKVDAHPL